MLKLRKGNIRLQKTGREDSKKQNIKIKNILLTKKKKKKNIRDTDRQLKEMKGKVSALTLHTFPAISPALLGDDHLCLVSVELEP